MNSFSQRAELWVLAAGFERQLGSAPVERVGTREVMEAVAALAAAQTAMPRGALRVTRE